MAYPEILLIESDSALATKICATLQSLGYHVLAAVSSREQAFNQLSITSPDLILFGLKSHTDIDSLEIAAQIQDECGIPVIFITSRAEDAALREPGKIVPYEYLVQPKEKDLRAIIELALHQYVRKPSPGKYEQWLYAILENIGDAVIICDKARRVVLMNSAAETITGWDHQDGLGKPLDKIFQIYNEVTAGVTEIPVTKVLIEGISTSQTYYILLTKDGVQKYIVGYAVPIVDNDRKNSGIIIVFRNTMARSKMSQLVKSIVQLAIELVGAHAGEIFLYDQEKDELRVAFSLGFMEEFKGLTLKPGEGMAGRVFQSGKPLIVDDYDTWEGKAKGFESTPPFTTILQIPLIWQDQCIGVLGVDADRRLHAYTENDVRMVNLFGTLAAIAIENVWLYEELQNWLEKHKLLLEQQVKLRTAELSRLARRLEISARVSNEITSIMNIDKLLDRVVSLIRDSFDYYYVQIFLVGNRLDRLVLAAASNGMNRSSEKQEKNLEIGPGSLNGLVAQTNQILLVNDVSKESNYLFDEKKPNTKSELVLPLKIASHMLGTLDIQSSNINDFTEEDKLAFKCLSDQIAVAIENARLYECSRDVAVLEERNRLARELHDSVTQSLFSMDLHARAIDKYLKRDPQQAKVQIAQLRQITHDTLEEMRSLINDLHPPSISEIGLIPALRQEIEHKNRPDGPKIFLSTSGDCRLPSELEEELFHIAQEALRNAVKHSRAQHITVTLATTPHEVALSITDDGIGFDPLLPRDHRAFGLIGMNERAVLLGTHLKLDAKPGVGTKVEVRVPIGKVC
jgi:PAS domain S-box-containing protein